MFSEARVWYCFHNDKKRRDAFDYVFNQYIID